MSANINKNQYLPALNNTLGVLDWLTEREQEKIPIPVNTAFIDSLSLKVKLSECTVRDERLTSMTATYYESLDSIDCELSPPKPVIIERTGIKIRFSLAQIPETCPVTKQKISVEYVVLTVSSKLLKSRYFEGINWSNIYLLYVEFMLFDVVHMSYETFLKSKVSDIDIAVNRRIENNDFIGVCRSLLSQADVRSKHARFFNDELQIGLQWNKRDWAKPSLPFIKLYQKELELQNRSFPFFFQYLRKYSKQIENLTRVEATIKNYAHRKRLENKKILPAFGTLEELLQIPESALFEFVCFSLNSYVTGQTKLKNPKLSPNDFLIFQLLQNCEDFGIDQVLEIADLFEGTTPEGTKVAKSRIRKKINDLWQMIGQEEKIQELKKLHNNEIKMYLKFFKVLREPKKKKAD